jgi:MYXO-CTERM domain-containing protein
MRSVSCGMAGVLVVFLTGAAHGGSITSLSSLGANDLVDWSVVGGTVGTTYTNSLVVASNGGLSVTASEPGTFATSREAGGQGGGWLGNFPANTVIVDDQFGGPVTFTFGAEIQGFGVSIDDAFGGAFTGTIQEFDGGSSLGTFHTQGTGLMFLGVLDAAADITSVVVSTVSGSGDNYFAFGNLSLLDSTGNSIAPSPTPEPGAAGVVLVGLGLFTLLRRRLL